MVGRGSSGLFAPGPHGQLLSKLSSEGGAHETVRGNTSHGRQAVARREQAEWLQRENYCEGRAKKSRRVEEEKGRRWSGSLFGQRGTA